MKNKITFLILFIVLGFCSLQAQITQEWVARYDGTGNSGDGANSLAVDDSGNVYVTGASYGNGTDYDYTTIKYNSSGVLQWVQSYNGPGNKVDLAKSIAVDGSGNVYVTGESSGRGPGYDYATIKYNSTGVQQWVSLYIGQGIHTTNSLSLAIDGSGNVYVSGKSSFNVTGVDYATIKYNSEGVQEWVKLYNGPGNGNDYRVSLEVDDSENVYVTGGNNNIATIKYNSSGIQQWIQTYDDAAAYSLAVDDSGNVYVTGRIHFVGSGDYATIKYNSSGIRQWVQTYNGPANGGDDALSLAVDGSGNVYVTGYSSNVMGITYDIATIKYISSGVQQWVQRYNGLTDVGSIVDDLALSLAIDGSGNVYVTGGSMGSGTGLSDFATIKYNSSGVQQWVQRYNGPGNGTDRSSSLAVDGSGNVYVTGFSTGGTGFADYATIKYSQTENIFSPSSLKAQSIDSSYIKVNWQDNSNDEDGFYIERTQINDSSHWEVIDVVPQNVNQYSDYFITRGLEYFYRVKAYSGNTYSEYSNTDSAILGGNPSMIPEPPSKLMLLKRTVIALQMGWLDNSGNENGFIIFRKSDEDLFFKIVDSVSTDVVTYQEVGVNPNLNYSYKICSFNSSGISDYSNTLIILAKSSPVKTQELSGNSILHGNYPNPFNPTTVISYSLIENRFTTLNVYDILGKEILTLVNEKQNAGTYSVEWDAGNYPSGVYFYKLAVDGNIVDTKRMMLLK